MLLTFPSSSINKLLVSWIIAIQSFLSSYIKSDICVISNIELSTGLADHDNYHEFCRLLGRFKVNYQVLRCMFQFLHLLQVVY